MPKYIKGTMPFGTLKNRTGTKHHEIWYQRDLAITQCWAKMSAEERKWFNDRVPFKNQSGFFFYQYMNKIGCLVETAKRCRDAGRISQAYYEYLITPVLP